MSETFEIYRIRDTSYQRKSSENNSNNLLILIVAVIIISGLVLLVIFLLRSDTAAILPSDDIVNLEDLKDLADAECCQPEFGIPNELFLRDPTENIIYTRSCEGCDPVARKGAIIYFEFSTGSNIPQCPTFVECPS